MNDSSHASFNASNSPRRSHKPAPHYSWWQDYLIKMGANSALWAFVIVGLFVASAIASQSVYTKAPEEIVSAIQDWRLLVAQIAMGFMLCGALFICSRLKRRWARFADAVARELGQVLVSFATLVLVSSPVVSLFHKKWEQWGTLDLILTFVLLTLAIPLLYPSADNTGSEKNQINVASGESDKQERESTDASKPI